MYPNPNYFCDSISTKKVITKGLLITIEVSECVSTLAFACFKKQMVLMWQRGSHLADLMVAPTGPISMCKHGAREENGICTHKTSWIFDHFRPSRPQASALKSPACLSCTPPFLHHFRTHAHVDVFFFFSSCTCSHKHRVPLSSAFETPLWLVGSLSEFITVQMFPFLSKCLTAGEFRSKDILALGMSPTFSFLILQTISPVAFLSTPAPPHTPLPPEGGCVPCQPAPVAAWARLVKGNSGAWSSSPILCTAF